MPKFKIITIKKRGGGTRKQRVQVLASGKFKFVKNKTTRKAPKRRSSSKKAPKRKASKRKSNKAPKRKSNVVKRSLSSKIPFVNNPTVKKVAMGVGLASIGVGVLGLVAPSIASNPIVKPALALLGGGIPGVIGQLIVGGGIPGITNILGGNGAQAQAVNNVGNTGFA